MENALRRGPEARRRGLLFRGAEYLRRGYVVFRREREIARLNRLALSAARGSGGEIWLEIGSGPRKGANGWITFDLPGASLSEGADLLGDLTNPLPFHDNEVARIYCSHVLEHFHIRELMKLLAECHRALCPGGTMSVAVPNARIYLDGYFASEKFDLQRFLQYEPAVTNFGRMDIVAYMAYMNGDHRYMFDEENLLRVLRGAGFARAELRGFDEALDLRERDYESIYALATK